MNRSFGRLSMRAALPAAIWVLIQLAPASAQVALIVGSVRDQRGAAVEGASVSASTAAGSRVATTTDAAGTFAVRAAGGASVTIACRYCATAVVATRPDQPVVAIVKRYDALLEDAPSPSDLANLPYAHVESAVALRPFTLLAQSIGVYPGSRVSDRGLESAGSPLVDDGAPNYDIVAGASPYATIPAGYEQSAGVTDAGYAFLYGDRAGGGVVDLQPFASGSRSQIALAGGDTILRAQVGSENSQIAVGSSSNDEESRQRADAAFGAALSAGQSVRLAAGTEQGRQYGMPYSAFASSFSFADATFDAPRTANLQVAAVADRGGYDAFYGDDPVGTVWSDTGLSAGIHSTGTVVAFADASTRFSTGLYDAQTLGLPRIGATVSQSRVDAGFTTRGDAYAVTGGVGMFWVGYTGGTYGTSAPASAAFATPSLLATLFPDGKWSLDLEGSGSFTLPTFFARYEYPDYPDDRDDEVEYGRNALYGASLNYTDDARVKFSFEEATQSVQGPSEGSVTSGGFSATWQVAPLVSLRAWTMHVTDTAQSYPLGAPYGGIAPTVNALWLTYDNVGAIRVDAIYRRDLLDNAPFYHVDAAVSGPIAPRVRWYAGAEDRQRTTYVDVGVRFSP